MSTYIYLNRYANGYLYVGSHTWSGDGIDPNYHGSSKVALYYGWVPTSVEILQEAPQSKLLDESKFIRQFCKLNGIAPCAKQMAQASNNTWVNNYKDGLMLNCHSNTLDAARSSLTKEDYRNRAKGLQDPTSHKKSLASRYSNSAWFCLSNGMQGHYKELSKALGIQETTFRSSVTPFITNGSRKFKCGVEIMSLRISHNGVTRFYEKRSTLLHVRHIFTNGWSGTANEFQDKFKVSRGVAYYVFNKVFHAGEYTYLGLVFRPVITSDDLVSPSTCKGFVPPLIKRNVTATQLQSLFLGRTSNKPYAIIAEKLRKSKLGKVPTTRIVECFNKNTLLCTGSTTSCCRYIGNPNWAIHVNRMFSLGNIEVIHHGYLFRVKQQSL